MKSKTFIIQFLLCFSLLTIVTACKSGSNDSGGTDYELTNFLGTWERTNSTSDEFKACSENPPILEITQTEVRHPFGDEDGCHAGVQIMEYEFDGQKFSVDAGWEFEVLSHSGSEFSWEDGFDGTTETYVRAEAE